MAAVDCLEFYRIRPPDHFYGVTSAVAFCAFMYSTRYAQDLNSCLCCFMCIFRIMLLNLPAIVLFNTLACTTGLAVFSYFSMSGCDPLANRNVQNPNQVQNLTVIVIYVKQVSVCIGIFACCSGNRNAREIMVEIYSGDKMWDNKYVDLMSGALCFRIVVRSHGIEMAFHGRRFS